MSNDTSFMRLAKFMEISFSFELIFDNFLTLILGNLSHDMTDVNGQLTSFVV